MSGQRSFIEDEQLRLGCIVDLYEAIRGGARPSAEACIDQLAPAFPLLAQLGGTKHEDADALTHTVKLLDALYAEFAHADLDAAARATLVLAAVLHAVGRTFTTRERLWLGELRTVAPGYAREGRWYVAPILFASGLPAPVAHAVTQLVGHHELAFQLSDASAGAYIRASRLVDPVLLYWLARADNHEAAELYKMFAIEYGAFGDAAAQRTALRDRLVDAFPQERTRTYDFLAARAARDLESGQIASPEQAIARSYEHLVYPELVVMVGPSGSGKSTYVSDRLSDFQIVTGEPRAAREEIRIALRAKGKVVYDAANLTADVRDRTCKLGFDYNAFVTIVVMAASEAVRHERAPDKVDEPALQWPELDEAHAIRIVGPDGKDILRTS